MQLPRLLLSVLLPAAALHAQLPLVLQDGNVVFSLDSLPASASSSAGYASLTAHPSSTTSVLFQHNWFYRVRGDTRESVLNSGGGQPVSVGSPRPDVGFVRFDDVDNRGLLAAEWTLQVASTGPAAGMLVSRLLITSRAPSALVLDVFAYADLDLCSFDGNVATAGPSTRPGTRQGVANPSRCANQSAEFLAAGADLWEVAAYASLRSRLLDGALDDLAASGLPFGPGDYSGAGQWRTRALLPGDTLEVVAVLSHDHSPCETPARDELYGTASRGTWGEPRIATAAAARLGTTARLSVTRGMPHATAIVRVGVTRTAIAVANVILLNEGFAALQFLFDAIGDGGVAVPIPPVLALCGAVVDFQCLFLDAAQAPLPVVHTAGLEWTIGGY